MVLFIWQATYMFLGILILNCILA